MWLRLLTSYLTIRSKKFTFIQTFHKYFSLWISIWVIGTLCDIYKTLGQNLKIIKVFTSDDEEIEIAVREIRYFHNGRPLDSPQWRNIYWRKLWYWKFNDFSPVDLKETYEYFAPFSNSSMEASVTILFAHKTQNYRVDLQFANMRYAIYEIQNNRKIMEKNVNFNMIFFDLDA